MRTSLEVAILVFDGVEVLDFAGPFEVFSTASRLAPSNEARQLKVYTISLSSDAIQCRGGLSVIPSATIGNLHGSPDIVVVPGGVIDRQRGCNTTIDWLRSVAAGGKIVASVCNGALILAAAGLLDGRQTTTHWQDIELLRQAVPTAVVSERCRFVDDGVVITSGGISAGIDMSLHLVRRFFGSDRANKTAMQMEYGWTE